MLKKPLSRRLTCLLLVLATPQTGLAEAPQQVPSFSAEVELITVDAVVVDEQGRPVSGLTKDDFVVKEDGKAQPIASFEAFTADEQAPPAVTPVATNTGGSGPGRVFGVVVDDIGMTAPLVEPTRDALLAFFRKSLRDGDEVTYATTSGDTFWSSRIPEGRADLEAVLARARGLKESAREMAWMTDYEAFWIAEHEDAPGLSSDSSPSVSGRGQPTRATTSADANHPGGQRGPKSRVMQRWLNSDVCLASVCESMVRNRAVEVDNLRRRRTAMTIAALRREIEALAPIRGRKSILLLSQGFLDDGGRELRDVVASSREANAAIYFVDLDGLTALSEHEGAQAFGMPEDPRDRSQMTFEAHSLADAGTEDIADESGGASIRGTNDITGAVADIAEESRVFYLLGFYPPDGKSEREWRKLKIEVKRPGLTVRARRGYTLKLPDEPGDKKDKKKDKDALPVSVARALDIVHPLPGLPLRAMSYVLEPRENGLTHVVLAGEVDTSRLQYATTKDARTAKLEVTAVAVSRDSGRGFRHDDTLDVAAKDASPGWRSFVREFELPAGVNQVRLVVRDPVSGVLGSVTQRLEVPAAGGLRLSTPILSDHLAPAQSAADKPRPALVATRTFAPRGALYCQFEVFGASMSGAGGGRVSAGLEVLGPGGAVVRRADPSPIAADPSGRVIRVLGLGLDGFPQGSYELVLRVEDQLGGASVERREPFVVSAGS
jgi:VWFA-related protein